MTNDMVVMTSDVPVSVEAIRQQMLTIQEIMKAVMKKGTHFDTIEGCGDKPVLLKAGAEKLGMTFRLIPKYEININPQEGGHREYETVCNLYSPSGTFLGSGVGTCSSLESKYRYRWQNTGNPVPKAYWQSRSSDLLGGSQYAPRKTHDGWMIFEKIEHADPADYYNTIKKMSKKRAHVDAIMTALSCSDIFTQDLEDLAEQLEPADHPAEKTSSDKTSQKPTETKQSASSAPLVTNKQINRLWAVAKENGANEETIRKIISAYGYESTKSIAQGDYDNILDAIVENGHKKRQEENPERESSRDNSPIDEDLVNETGSPQ